MCDNANCSCGKSGQNHHRSLISDIHSFLERELENKDLFVPDNAQTAECRKRIAEFLDNPQNWADLGDALVYQMRYLEAIECFEKALGIRPDNFEIRRKLSARYLLTLQLDKAEKGFEWCLERTEDKLDGLYRLALTAFYRGDYALCRERMSKCYSLAEDNGEMYIAVLYWDLISAVKLGDNIAPVLNKYSDDIECGHHVGYELAVKLFLNDDLSMVQGAEGHGELAITLYLYGLYHYHLMKGEKVEAQKTFDYLMTLNTYFSSFAFLGAYTDKLRMNKEEKLINFLQNNNNLAIAFSGGVDSAYLLYMAKKSGINFKAYFAKSEFQPEFELNDAKKLASQFGAQFEILNIEVLNDKAIIANDEERCYYCKKRIVKAIFDKATKDGFTLIADGSNATDSLYYRAGVKALNEFGIVSPLKEVGLTKNEIRQLSREAKLFTADKPSYSCLATRLNQGQPLTADMLDKVQKAENILFSMNYKDFRVRVKGNSATLEINAKQKNKAFTEFNEVKEKFIALFDDITLSDNWR